MGVVFRMSFTDQENEEFKAEAFELLDVAERSLLSLDQGAEYKPCFDAIFRSFHNLKGAAGMMEMLTLQGHMHELENILMRFKETTSIPKPFMNLFLRGIDASRGILAGEPTQFDFHVEEASQAVSAGLGSAEKSNEAMASPSPVIELDQANVEAKGSESVPNEPLVASRSAAASTHPNLMDGQDPAMGEFIAECFEICDRVESALQKIELADQSEAARREVVESLYRDVHSLKGAAYLYAKNDLGDLAHAMESCLEPIRDTGVCPPSELIDVLLEVVSHLELEVQSFQPGHSAHLNSNILQSFFERIQGASTVASAASSGSSGAAAAPRVSAPETHLSSAVASREADELASQRTVTVDHGTKKESLTVSGPATYPLDEHHQVKESNREATKELAKDAEANSSIRVSVALLDNLMTLMGEMVLVRNQVLQFSSQSEDLEFLNLSKRLNVVTSEIQGEMMKTRMQPIGNILSKFNRVVRDLSHDLEKEISLHLSGAETELDKSLLEAIKDPLTHIVRNSCDHGIEAPDVRAAAGKSKAGRIEIRSYHEGGQVVIEVIDDGKGLSREALIKKGIERGLITSGQASSMSEKEVFSLIFAPGFSTAATITNVSGRGVGMDVVRTNIERIGGTVELASVFGRGTTIKLKIPLTLAIVPALIIRNGEQRFAIPQVKLEELVRVDQSSAEDRVEFLQGAPVYRLRGNILPLVSLNAILSGKKEKLQLSGVNNIAVVNADGTNFGLIVDEVQDTADIVVKPINRLLKSLHIYSGATILGDGSIALIVDVPGIAKVAKFAREGVDNREAQIAQTNSRRVDLQEFLLVRLQSGAKHAIVLGYVHRLEEFRKSQVEFSGKHRVVRYGQTILLLVGVNESLGYNAQDAQDRETISVVVIQKAGAVYGLVVDEILDTLSTDVEVDTSLKMQPGLFGNLNTESELIVVIDPFEVISLAMGEKRPEMVLASRNVSPSASPLGEVAATPLRILFVEDTAFFRRVVKGVLDRAGHRVSVAIDGQEALEILEKDAHAFDLVLSDIEMPRMNGFELVSAVRAHKSAISRLPMIALSSRADRTYAERGRKAGFNLYLEKLNPDLLLRSIEDVLAKKGNVA